MAVKQLWSSPPQFVDANGDPYSGALLFFYAAGSSTKQNVYTDSGGGTAASNPTTLNSSGYPANSGTIFTPFGTVGQTYKIGLAAPGSSDPPASFLWSVDNIAPTNDVSVSIDQWVTGPAPTYISATSFSLVGDQTSDFHVGRRLKTTNSGGTVYSTITASAYGAVTTVTVVNDSGSLDAGLSAVSYGLLSNVNKAIPPFNEVVALTSASGTNTITASATKSATGYVSGQMYLLIPAGMNSGATTLNVNSLGAKNVFRNGLACVGGELRTGVPSLLSYDGTQFNIHTIAAPVAAFSKAIYGLTYANNGSDATNDIDIAVGGAMDATGAYFMRLGSALTKQSDAAWAVGTNAGWLDTGAVGNSDYYIWLIARSDTGVVDSLCSLSSTAPTMPANYDYKRLIGWFKRTGGTIVAFHTYETEGGGIEHSWDVPTLDVNLSGTLTTSRRTDAVKVPLNFSVVALLNVVMFDAGTAQIAWVYCPDITDAAPSSTVAPLNNFSIPNAGDQAAATLWVRTSATGTVAARAGTATMDLYAVVTIGFRWARRN